MRRAVIALGGNSLVRDAAHASIVDQNEAVAHFAPTLVDLIEQGWRLVVTHGNGPQVGYILRRSELSLAEVAPVPLDYAVADTQGAIGHMFLTGLRNELQQRGLQVPVVALVTQTLVDGDDIAFGRPSKPIGAFFDEETARHHATSLGWVVAEDAGRGWRRLVASPEPQAILELATIRQLSDSGAVIIAGGGGGIAVVMGADGRIRGVEAVIDKDLSSSLLAIGLDAELLAIPTSVERLALDFGQPDQRWVDQLDVEEASALLARGEFAVGSMGPKMDALVRFARSARGRTALLTTMDRLGDALAGRAGTRIVNT